MVIEHQYNKGVETNLKTKMKKYILIDLYTHKATILSEEEVEQWIIGMNQVEGDVTSWSSDEYVVVEV